MQLPDWVIAFALATGVGLLAAATALAMMAP
jgi:hypothetical protein